MPESPAPIYLDYHATTPVDERVVAAMLPFFTERFGNAASRQHAFGWEASKAVERARKQVAALVDARPAEVVFTSGATEANNLALFGVMRAAAADRRHLVTLTSEHRSVLDPSSALETEGFAVTRVPVRADGLVDLDVLARALGTETALVSVMTANNEVGVLQPLDAIAGLAHDRGILVHSDAAQAAGKVPPAGSTSPADLISLSGHKIYGPKGVGALVVRRRVPRIGLAPLLHGGGHEQGLRSGTLDVPAIVGFGAAAALCLRELDLEVPRLLGLRTRLVEALAVLPGLHVHGSIDRRLANNLNVGFDGVHGDQLLLRLTDVALSSGAACSSATARPSHVLQALGVPDDLARASIRIGLGRWTTAAEVDRAAKRIREVVTELRTRRAAG